MAPQPGRRWLLWVVGALAPALVLAGTTWAATRPRPPSYTTAIAAVGTITESWMATGSVTRVEQVAAAFAASGEVSAVHVRVGDPVTAGQELASIDATQLELAVVQAEAAVAQARAQLDADLNAGSAAPGAAAAAAAAQAQAQALAQAQAQIQQLATQLAAAQVDAAASKAQLAALQARQQLVAGLLAAVASPGCVATFSAGPAPSSLPGAVAGALPVEAGHAPLPDRTPTASEAPVPSAPPTATAAPLSAEATACLDSLQALIQAATATPSLQGVTPPASNADPVATGLPTASGVKTSTPATAASLPAPVTGTSGVNEARVASDRAALLQAQQGLAAAESARDNATLRAPISGQVGALTLTEGLASAGRTVTIVGPGAAEVTLQVPLAVRSLVAEGQQATVSPPGSALELPGTLTRIDVLPTSSSGSPTYATTVAVPDAEGLLNSGSVATVLVAIGQVRDVTVVPASAVTPTGESTGTLQLVEDGVARPVQVTLGARGGGRVQVTEGVRPGQVVVLADHGVAVPANSFQRRPTSTPSATPVSSTGASAVPSATPSR